MRLLSSIAVRPAAISFRWFRKAFNMYTEEALEQAITSCCDVNMELARQHLQRVSTVHGHCHATWLIGVALGSVEALSTSSVAFPPNEVAPPGKAIMKCASIITAPPLTCPRLPPVPILARSGARSAAQIPRINDSRPCLFCFSIRDLKGRITWGVMQHHREHS